MSDLRKITTTQFIIKLEKGFKDGALDLTNLDMRYVDMRTPNVRELFTKLTMIAALSQESSSLYIDLSHSNISGRDFSNYNLSSVIMTGIIAEHSLFTYSNLTDSNIDDAYLNYSDFRKANLTYTKLYNSSIHGANFMFADLTKTYGLCFGKGDEEIIERLKSASDITGAILPENVKKLRSKINRKIARPQKSQDTASW